MVQRVTIEVEQFDKGVTVHYYDANDEGQELKKMAIGGCEAGILGNLLWRDVSEVLSKSGKVNVAIEYTPF
jgi:hypothetical protein